MAMISFWAAEYSNILFVFDLYVCLFVCVLQEHFTEEKNL